jgi:hypothetical protein
MLNLGVLYSGFLKKKVYLDGMSILSIILSLESGCHRILMGRFKSLLDELELRELPL